MPLADIVTALCLRAGLTEADLDVSELTDGVRGYALARQVSVRGALEMLAAAYTFDAVESDHQLKFKKRGREPSRVISEQDLVPVNAERSIHRDAGAGGRPAAPLHGRLPGPRARRRHRHAVRQAGGGAEQRHTLARPPRRRLRTWALALRRRGGGGEQAIVAHKATSRGRNQGSQARDEVRLFGVSASQAAPDLFLGSAGGYVAIPRAWSGS